MQDGHFRFGQADGTEGVTNPCITAHWVAAACASPSFVLAAICSAARISTSGRISAASNKLVKLVTDSAQQQWRPFAKDGYELPPAQATLRSAVVIMGPGETWDFDVKREKAESLQLEVTTNPGPRQRVARIPVIVH